MRKLLFGAAAVGLVVSVAAGRRFARRPDGATPGDRRVDRWHSVTVNCAPERLDPLPACLSELGDAVEVVMRPAPGGRGTELAARLVERVPSGVGGVVAKLRDDDPVRRLRRALRDARALAEIGEILLPDSPATTRSTLLGAPLAYAVRHGREEGRL
jgi:hypothetical protein